MSSSETPSDPDALRAEIERTRAELGDTVEALAAKADVKARAKEAVSAAGDRAKQKAAQAADAVKGQTAQAVGVVKGQTTGSDNRDLIQAAVAGAAAAVLIGVVVGRIRNR